MVKVRFSTQVEDAAGTNRCHRPRIFRAEMTIPRDWLSLTLFGASIVGASQAWCDPPAATPFGRKPYVAPSPAEAPSPAQMKDKFLERLQRDFEVADTARVGSLTREQVNGAGLSVVSRHFDEIDIQHTGRVSFEQVSAFLRGQDSKP
jgi:hypothetical protein